MAKAEYLHYIFHICSYAGPSHNRPIWLGQLQCDSSDNMLGSCSRLDTAIGSVALCKDRSLNIDAAVNCNTTTSQGMNIYLIILMLQLCTVSMSE